MTSTCSVPQVILIIGHVLSQLKAFIDFIVLAQQPLSTKNYQRSAQAEDKTASWRQTLIELSPLIYTALPSPSVSVCFLTAELTDLANRHTKTYHEYFFFFFAVSFAVLSMARRFIR